MILADTSCYLKVALYGNSPNIIFNMIKKSYLSLDENLIFLFSSFGIPSKYGTYDIVKYVFYLHAKLL